MQKHLIRVAGVAVAAIAAVAATAIPAHASFQTDIYLDTHGTAGARDGGGYAYAHVPISFNSKRNVSFNGYVQDVCPGDGKGAYLTIHVHQKDGTIQTYQENDKNGCTKISDQYSGETLYVIGQNGGKRVTKILARVCERDAAGRKKTVCSGWITRKNPYM